MNKSTQHGFSRREFLAGTSIIGAAALLGIPRTAAAEPPPETTRIRLVVNGAICLAPQYMAEELLRKAESIGRPLGSAAFLTRQERKLGRTLKPAKRGPKPAKEKE